jgi:AraC-like DNA-binding protein
MPAITEHQSGLVSILEYVCSAGPGAKPYAEQHQLHSISFVRRGSFGYRARGRASELVAGSVLAGQAGDEFTCTHEHHACGDECLSLQFDDGVADLIAARPGVFRVGAVPPISELMILAELTEAAVAGRTDVCPTEAALAFAARFVEIASERAAHPRTPTDRERRRAVQAALFIELNSASELPLQTIAQEVDSSPFQFLRSFSAVLGVTPHQYLVRSRLRHAARLLADERRSVTDVALDVGFGDLSNFVNSFRRAVGLSPRAFRRAAAGDRNFLQERIGHLPR